jgi:Ca2+-dependent lipid-binding protein
LDEDKRRKEEADAQAAVPCIPGLLRVFVDEARGLLKADTFNQSDPFVEVKVSLGDKNVLRSKTIDDNANPIWNFQGDFKLALQQYKDMKVMLTVYDYDVDANDFLGFVEVDIDSLFKNPG